MQQSNDNNASVRDEWQVKAEEYLQKWKRAEADFTNYRKDEEKRVAEMLKFGNQAVLMQMITVIDGLQLAMGGMPKDILEKHPDWVKGMEKVIEQFRELLKKYGVEYIKVVGEKFDPLIHEAVEVDNEWNNDNQDGQVVLQEYQSGYKLHDRVLRPARVKVSK